MKLQKSTEEIIGISLISVFTVTSFGENFMRSRGKMKRIVFGSDLESSPEVSAKDAFIDMFIDAKFSKSGLVNLVDIKWPTEPGIRSEASKPSALAFEKIAAAVSGL